jgi:hypothetical protein
LVMKYRLEDRQIRMQRQAVWYLMALYYSGYQNVSLNSSSNAWDVSERDDFYVENQLRKHVDTVVNMLVKGEGDILARPGSDSAQDIAKARVSDSVLSSMRDTVGYDKVRVQKSLFKVLFGNSFVFADYIVDKRYGTIVSPKFSYEEMPGPDGEMMPTKVPDGFEKRNRGSEIAIACSPLEINVKSDIKGGLENVPYLQWITRQDLDTVNYVYPGLNMGEGKSQTEQDMSRQYIQILGNLAGNITGNSPSFDRSQDGRMVELVRSWLQPCTFLGDKELQNEFPDGAHVTTVNGVVVDWYPEVLTDRWTHEVLIPSPHSMLGDGLYDALLMQDQINEINSLIIQHMRYSTIGHKVYDTQMIDAKDIINDPKNGWIKASNIPMDKKLSDAVKELPPTALSQDVPAWKANLLQSMQDMSSAYDPATGKGIGANTPYSQSVFLNEKAQGRWAASRAYNKPEVIRFHRQLLTIARDNWVDPRRRAFQTQAGEWSFEQFTQADLQGEVDIILTDSDMKPRSRAEQIQGLQMLTELAPLLPGMPPRQKLRIEEMLGLPPDANPSSSQISRAYRVIERIKKGETVSPLALVDDPNLQVSVFQDFLSSEAGEDVANASPELYAAIYQYMVTLAMIGTMQQASPMGQHMSPPANGAQPGGGSSPQPPSGEPGQPGGQPGQQGGGKPKQGGPGAASQPNAQSPVQPAPPVSSPSA